MNDNMSEYKGLIHLMEATPQAPAPEHFTEMVMGQLPELDQGIWAKAKHALFNPSGGGMQTRWAQILSVSDKWECSFCFFITGFFYLIMGLVLMAGFKAIGSSLATMEWIKMQPQLTIGVAIWLFALGFALMLDDSAGIKAARYGTLFFIFFAVANGILMLTYLHLPYAGMFITGFVATSALMGVMLALAVQKMELRTV